MVPYEDHMAKSNDSKQEKTAPAQRPAAIVRQGNLKCLLWRNQGENGAWYTADLVRTFKTESGFQETNKVPADDLLRVAFLAQQSFTKLQELKAQDRAGQQEEHDESPQP